MKKEYQATNYESDLTDKQWEAIKEFFPSGNKSKYHKRSLVEEVLYIVKTGCQWRMLPHDYPPHDTVQIRWEISCVFTFMRQIFTIQRAAYTRLKKHFIDIRPFRRDVQMAVIEEHSGILLMNFTISELIFLCKSKNEKDFRFSQNVGLLNVLSHG